MEFDLIKEPIQKSINYAMELINQFNEENPEEIKIENPQINFIFENTLKTKEIKFFINKYKAMFEKNLNAFNSLYKKKSLLNEILLVAKKINRDLNTLNSRMENLKSNVFQKGLKGLRNDKLKELKKLIAVDIKKYNEERDKFMKEFKRRNMEILSILNTYLYLLIKLIKNIKKLSETINIGFHEFNESSTVFVNNNGIKTGKYVITEEYRQFALITSEIKNIFIFMEKTSKKRAEEYLKKLKGFDENLKTKYNEIYQKINQFRENIKYDKVKINNLSLGFEEIAVINDDCSKLEKEMSNFHEKIKENYKDVDSLEKEFRVDLLIILDTTSSMGYFIDKFKFQFLQIIQDIRKEIPEAIVYVGLIGYKDIFDKELGDDYLDYDFTTNYEKLKNKIEEIEPDGGIDIPEDIPGAFQLAFDKIGRTWKGNTKIAILITDSPCHGVDFHNLNQNNDEQRDEYPNGDPENRDIKELVRKFVKNKISLFCLELNKMTEKMYGIFKKVYEGVRPPEAKFEFSIEKDLTDYKFMEKIQKLFNYNLDELRNDFNRKHNNNNIININNEDNKKSNSKDLIDVKRKK
jgi:hypothetical protein